MSTQATVPTPMPSDFGRDFKEMYAGLEQQIKAITTGQQVQMKQRFLGKESARLMARSRELFDQMQAQGWVKATIINFNPFPIKVNGILHDEILPACEPDQDYARLTIDDWGLDRRDNGEGVFTCHAWVPVQLAADYLRECQLNEWGGVFFYPGEYAPDDPNMPSELKKRVQKEMAEARAACLKWCRKMVRVASAAHDSPNGDRRIIGDQNHRALSWLMARGYVQEKDKPKWAEMSSTGAVSMVECPNCHKRVEQGVPSCSCTYVFDPEAAYLNGTIGDQHPSLKRLPQADLDRLELTHVKSIAHLLKDAPAPRSVTVAATSTAADHYAKTGLLPPDEDELAAAAAAGADEDVGLETNAAATAKEPKAAKPAAGKDKKEKKPKEKTKQQEEAEKAI